MKKRHFLAFFLLLGFLGCKTRTFSDTLNSESVHNQSNTMLTRLADGREVDLTTYQATAKDLQDIRNSRVYASVDGARIKFIEKDLQSQVADTARLIGDDYITKIPLEELFALKKYSSQMFPEFTAALTGERKLLSDMQPLILGACSGLTKFPIYNGTVWSGRSEAKEFLQSLQPGYRWPHSSFVSTSKDELNARKFLSNSTKPPKPDVLLKIHSTRGRKFWEWSNFGIAETEVLYPPGIIFTVVSVKQMNPNFYLIELRDN